MSTVRWTPVTTDKEFSGHKRESQSHSESISVRMLQTRNFASCSVNECGSLTGKAKHHLYQSKAELFSWRTIRTHSTAENNNLNGKICNTTDSQCAVKWFMKGVWQICCVPSISTFRDRVAYCVCSVIYIRGIKKTIWWPISIASTFTIIRFVITVKICSLQYCLCHWRSMYCIYI
jgi:hypothetical protein